MTWGSRPDWGGTQRWRADRASATGRARQVGEELQPSKSLNHSPASSSRCFAGVLSLARPQSGRTGFRAIADAIRSCPSHRHAPQNIFAKCIKVNRARPCAILEFLNSTARKKEPTRPGQSVTPCFSSRPNDGPALMPRRVRPRWLNPPASIFSSAAALVFLTIVLARAFVYHSRQTNPT